MKKLSHILWPILFIGAASLIPSCGGKDNDASGDGDGDGGGDVSGDGDGDSSTGGGAGGPGLECEEECADDGDPCTEDICNPATGECGVPRTGNSCNDGIFCNGADTCDEGECTGHAGDPCSDDGLTCNEGNKGCECVKNEDCGEPYHSEYSDCVHTSECAAGVRTRNLITPTCNGSGVCENISGASEPDTAGCPAQIAAGQPCTTDGVFCNGSEVCNAGGSCVPTGENPCARFRERNSCREHNDTCVQCLTKSDCSGTDICCPANGYICQASGTTCSVIISPNVFNIVNPNIVNPNIISPD